MKSYQQSSLRMFAELVALPAKEMFVNTICSSGIQMNNFIYLRFDKKNKLLRITVDPKWATEYYDTGLNLSTEHYAYLINKARNSPNNKYMHIWIGSDKIDNSKIYSALYKFNFCYGIYMVSINTEYAEIYGFAAGKENPAVIDYYLNNTNFLYEFCNYFKANFVKNLRDTVTENININIFDKPSNNDHKVIYCCANGYKFQITDTEAKCLNLIKMGMSYKYVAIELGISPRTVETHINHIREKGQVHSKFDLIHSLIVE